MAELKTYKQKVRVVLQRYPKTRNSDGLLFACYILTYHPHMVHEGPDGEKAIKLKYMEDLPPMENIRRSRQLIQSPDGDNEYLPTELKVREARKIKEENWRECEVREAKNA